MQAFLDKWKLLVNWMSNKGIPIPLLRNPRHNESSVTFTMVIISFLICILALFELFKFISFDHSFELFMASSALYFGRNFQKKNISLTQETKKET